MHDQGYLSCGQININTVLNFMELDPNSQSQKSCDKNGYQHCAHLYVAGPNLQSERGCVLRLPPELLN